MALTVNNIALGYRKNDQTNVILQDVSFDVPEKSLTCILGPSGVGKSSLLRVIAGLDNLDFTCHKRSNKAEISQNVDNAIAEVGLTYAINAMPHELSGGMAQRVNLARAIARQPKLILMDEPFSALDPIIRQQMQLMTREIIDHHHTSVVMITHDIDEALAIADQVILLGNRPANIVGRWDIVSSYPRENLLLLNEIHVDILKTLQRNENNKKQEQTVEFVI